MTPSTIGHYRILGQLGSGGMGEVYLAEDTKLGRRVALKRLTDAMAGDAERRSRFEREARAVAALNHPHIVTIHSVEEHDGVVFLTMELVEGKTLGELMTRQGMPLEQLLKIAIPLADAVGAAHQKGITHRDLKPANVMVASDGRLKVLDFGLAKLQEAALQGGATTMATAHVTGEGRIVGTVAYMAPEQAEGKPTDPRSDIFSLGILLFEMATGERPFKGDTNVSLLSAILKDTPRSLTELRTDLPRDLARIVKRCLAKDPDERYQTAKDLRNDLKALKEDLDSGQLPAPSTTTQQAVAAPRRRRGVVPALTIGALVVALGAAAWFMRGRQPGAPGGSGDPGFESIKMTRLTATGTAGVAAVSPDGRYVVHVVHDGPRASLWMRQVATASNVQIQPLAEGRYDGLAFSPDGEYVYYNRYEKGSLLASLYRLPVLGGTPRKLLDDVDSAPAFSPDGKRFAFLRGFQQEQRAAVMLADADGSNVRELASRPQPTSFRLTGLAWSPDGRHVAAVAVAHRRRADAELYPVLVDVATGAVRPLGEPVFVEIGGLGWLHDGRVVFDARRLERAADETNQVWTIAVAEGAVARTLTNDLNDYRAVSVGAAGRVVVAAQGEYRASLWLTPEGDDDGPAQNISQAATGREGVVGLDWMPDGRVVYASAVSGNWDIWIVGADGTGRTQLTSDPSVEGEPAVSPDGRTIVFVSNRSGEYTLWAMDPQGGNVREISREPAWLPAFTPDGRHVIARLLRDGRELPVRVPLDGSAAQPIFADPTKAPFQFAFFALSPDGRTMAGRYLDVESRGSRGILVPLDGSAPTKLPPLARIFDWSRDGRAIEEARPGERGWNLWRVPIDGSAPRQLTNFEGEDIFFFRRSRDGRRLAISRGTGSSDIVMITPGG